MSAADIDGLGRAHALYEEETRIRWAEDDAARANGTKGGTEPKPPRLRSLSVAQFLALEIPPREMVLGPWLPEKGLVLVHSPRGVGKTHFALAVGYAVASAGQFLGFKAPKARRVV